MKANYKPDYKNVEDLSKIKGWAIVTYYFEQYALGVTGTHKRYKLILETDKPFKTKKEAVEFAKRNGIKNYQRKGQPNEGYGSKGQIDFQVHFVRTNELARNEKWDKFYDVKEYYTSSK